MLHICGSLSSLGSSSYNGAEANTKGHNPTATQGQKLSYPISDFQLKLALDNTD